ncbi:MAG TPA: ATP-dependent sacrificial sulfur transferase LarE [bacterium]|nr:ATP-dependent sacrificial sulfur transferase LarE [bacterium]
MMTAHKIEKFNEYLKQIGSGLVALSGGVDSAVLLLLASRCREFRVKAATVLAAAHPPDESDAARKLAADLNVAHLEVPLDLLRQPEIRANGPDRCYHCKRHIYSILLDLAREHALDAVLDGSNADDSPLERPGSRAIRELGVRTPLSDVGLGKEEIREIARRYGLPMWNKPATACVFTRIPAGEVLEQGRLKRVVMAENRLRGMGFPAVRVRDHGDTARIEVPVDFMESMIAAATQTDMVRELKGLGYRFVTLDLSGYRSGSMNHPAADGCIEDP